jgi:ABC transport system ATP-binding/permease protein
MTLRKALVPDGDSVVYRDRTIHVVSWAERFLFTKDQLDLPIKRLSGGEQARILIANLMEKPADVLLLDEPTNDLDIQSLEVLEESLIDFPGAVVLVSHDRAFLDRLTDIVLAFDNTSVVNKYADYNQ